jgi:hypothetical protein
MSSTLGVTGLLSANNITVATNVNVKVLNYTSGPGTNGATAALFTNAPVSSDQAVWIPVTVGGTNYLAPLFLK